MQGPAIFRLLLIFILPASVAGLSGCGGDDGDPGPRGAQGDSAVVGERTVAPEKLFPKITGVSISSGVPTIRFQVTDERGLAVAGIQGGAEFTVNKLVLGADGETNNWRTYIRADDQGSVDAQAGTWSDGTLTGNGDGSYRFRFNQSLHGISGVSYEPNLTHRVGIELRDVVVLGKNIPAGGNDVYDFRPSTGATSGITGRAIVKQENCAGCHGTEEFAFHGGPRQDVDYCVTCHQPGSVDAGTGNTMDFRVMIHKIHFGENLNNKPYEFCGFGCERFGRAATDFSHVAFPQDTRNCTTCHDPADPDTPQADNINNRPTAAVCASCHDDLAFDDTGLTNTGGNHPAGAQPNSNCASCHSEGGLFESVLESHEIPRQVWAKRFRYNLLAVDQTAEGQSPMVTFSITDPANGDAVYDLINDPAFTGDQTGVSMNFAWPTSDYTNVANNAGTAVTGTAPSRPLNVPVADGSGTLPTGVTDNGDGTYTLDTAALGSPLTIPATTPPLGSGAVAMEGHVSGDFNGDSTYDDQVPVTGAVKFFAINDARVTPRREVVSDAKCQTCHAQHDRLAFHGNSRTDNTQLCVVCHNPNQTDLFMRPEDPDEAFDGVNTAALDNLEDRGIDFKYMIHAIHGASKRENGYVAYGYGVQSHDFSEVGFPRPVNDCKACHVEGSFALPLGSNVLGTTLSAGATVDTTVTGFFPPPGATAYHPGDGSASDPTDDHNISATAAACAGCHDSASAADHMSRLGTSNISFGDAFLLNPDPVNDPDTQADIDAALPGGENCSFCHGSGGIADVAEVHGQE